MLTKNNSQNNKTFSSELTDGKDVRWFGTFNDPWFIAKDIAEILGYKDTKQSIRKNINTKDRISYKKAIISKIIQDVHLYKTIQPQTILINKQGLICFLQNCRKYNKDFLKYIKDEYSITTMIIKRLTKEEEYMTCIRETFEGEEIIQQFRANLYNVDLYFPVYKLAVECDEQGHKDRNKEYEVKRESEITNMLKCNFIRFNPDSNNFNIFSVINKIYKKIKENIKNKEIIIELDISEEVRTNPRHVEIGVGEKLCTICKQVLKYSDFEMRASHPRRQCKKCKYKKQRKDLIILLQWRRKK